jgi:hypothetical protein
MNGQVCAHTLDRSHRLFGLDQRPPDGLCRRCYSRPRRAVILSASSEREPEELAESCSTNVSETERARSGEAFEPAVVERAREECRADGAGEVVTTFAPVEAAARERAPPAIDGSKVDTETEKDTLPCGRDLVAAVVANDRTLLFEGLCYCHRGRTRKMVVAGAGKPDRLAPIVLTQRASWRLPRDDGDRLQH